MATMRAGALLLSLLAAPGGAAAADDVPRIREGASYASARGTLIAKGFRPVSSGNRDDGRCPAGRQDVCEAYPETVSCSGTGSGACRFIFSGKAATLTIVADGDDVGRLRVVTTRRSSATDAKWQRAGR